MIASELQRQYGDKGIVSIAVNPGNLDSELYRHLPKLAVAFMVSSSVLKRQLLGLVVFEVS